MAKSSVVLALALLAAPVSAQQIGTGCVEGVDCTPPMGWRSWNTYGPDISQDIMQSVMDAMALKNDDGVSFLSLGYSDVGLDDNYQQCGSGVNGSFHSLNSDKTAYINNINTDIFPDMKSMTNYGHNLGFTVGFYENNCICDENGIFFGEDHINEHYAGDVQDMVTYGYDSVKLDGCGQFLDLELYQQLLNETGSYYLIENCHWGETVPTLDWCPFSYFRTSGDIKATWESMWKNLQTTIAYQDMDAPLSRQGCWAYPDMLEVGNMPTHTEDRSHFGAWCITSSPLILGHNITNTTLNDLIWDIVANTEAIAVNQAWHGHPGYLADSYNPQVAGDGVYAWADTCTGESDQAWTLDMDNNRIYRTSDKLALDFSGGLGEVMLKDIDGSSEYQDFELYEDQIHVNCDSCCESSMCCMNANNNAITIAPCNGDLGGRWDQNETNFALINGAFLCLEGISNNDPDSTDVIQVWAKPISDDSVAVFVVSGLGIDKEAYTVTINFENIGFSADTTMSLRDIWNQEDIEGSFTGSYTTGSLSPRDSFFFLMTVSS